MVNLLKKYGSGKLVAHLELNRFGELTDEQWDKAVDEIVNQKNLAGVVLDLRNNREDW
jgi:C-terminal processing protease CtpA/Prc